MSDVCLGSPDSLFYSPGSLCLQKQRLETPKPKKHLSDSYWTLADLESVSDTNACFCIWINPITPWVDLFHHLWEKGEIISCATKGTSFLEKSPIEHRAFHSPATVDLYLGTFCSGCRDNAMHTTLADHCDLLLFEEIRFPEGIKHKKLERSDNTKCWGMTCSLIFF